MAKWTETQKHKKHVAKIGRDTPIGGLVLITLFDGVQIEGVLQRTNVGNNAGRNGWQYHGECEIQTKDGKRRVIDYLDIKSIRNIWSDEKAKEYEELGLIVFDDD